MATLSAHADASTYGVYADMTDGKPFYIGKGNEARFRNTTPRNPVHADRLRELGGGHQRVWISKPSLDETTALRREAEIIEKYGDTLTNQRRGDVKYRELSFTDRVKHRYKVHVQPKLNKAVRFAPKAVKGGSKVVPVAGVVTFVGFEAYGYTNWKAENQDTELIGYIDHRIGEVQQDAVAVWDFTFDVGIRTVDAAYDAGAWTGDVAVDLSVAAKDKTVVAAGWTAETFNTFAGWTADTATETTSSAGSLVTGLRDFWGI